VKAPFVFVLLLGMSLCRLSHADTSNDFVRIACVPEAGLLDVEVRSLHDSIASGPEGQDKRNEVLARAGFHDPHGLAFTCRLGAITYLISSQQDETSNRMCGGSPEVYLTVTRDGTPLLSNVVTGDSCHELPSITRLTVADGPGSWRGRETKVCYSSGKADDPGQCEWTGEPSKFERRFPIDADRLQRIVTRQERR
jgi:hypothetical protein